MEKGVIMRQVEVPLQSYLGVNISPTSVVSMLLKNFFGV
jgi:hypothetical protein